MTRIGETLFKGIVGFLTLLYCLIRFLGWKLKLPASPLLIAITGFLGGIFSTGTGMSSIPIIWLLGSTDISPTRFRLTTATFVFLNGLLSLAGLILTGIFKLYYLTNLLFYLPALMIGLCIGLFNGKKLSDEQLEKVTLIYFGIIGLFVLFQIIHK